MDCQILQKIHLVMADVVNLLRGSKEPTIVHTDYAEEKTIPKICFAS